MIYKDNCNDNTNVLFIKKNGENVSIDKVLEERPWFFCNYNHKTGKYELSEVLEIGDFSDDLNFDNSNFKVISSIPDKINYAFACMHNDEYVESVIKEIFPHIKEVQMCSGSYCNGNYLRIWMEKYNFTLKDFILNDKYVVLNCTGYFCNEFESLIDNALINWDELEYCSEYEWKEV